MQSVLAVEAAPSIENNPEFIKLLIQETELQEARGCFFIYLSREAAGFAKELLEIGELFEEIHPLVSLLSGIKGPAFYDFGLDAESGGVYLFTQSLSAFSISSEDAVTKQMALFQMEEHLVFTADEDNQFLFFTEKHNEQLIRKIANAYQIEADFLVLDK